MGEIKSAFEKAMEKLEGLGKLSPEELRERKEMEYAPVGQALAEKYLGHGYVQIFREEIDKYQGDEKGIVTKAALSRLVESVQLRDYEMAERAVAGILTLKDDNRIEEIREKIKNLCNEFKQAEQQKYEQEKGEVEKRGRELLHRLRISGSAIGEINTQVSDAWKRISDEVYSQFEERLSDFKRELLNL